MSILPQWLTNIWNPNADAGAAADAQLRAMNSVDYAPGGKIYEKIAAERGTAAADAAQAQVTANYDTQAPIGETAQNAAIDQAFTDSLDASASNLIGSPLAERRFGKTHVYGHLLEDDRHLIISAGLGTSFLPVRFGRPPELTIVDIGSAAIA